MTDAWKPVLCSAGEVERLKRSGALAFVHDEIALQLAELVQSREPARKLAPDEVRSRIDELAGGKGAAFYGAWFHYPWLKSLVHVLPKAEFQELRTHVNRHKITREEQAKLAGFTVGVVGLSVGQSTAVTLALEGVGGHFRLADFDTLNLGNMNRLRAGVQALGVNKAVLTAREIFELDPYASVTIFPEGITDANMEDFLDGLGLLFEESDDLRMKVLLRERARSRGIPVLMGTSDRGLLDVERFDREPERPIFHGLTGHVDGRKISAMTPYEKLPIGLAIVGPHISPRLAVSLLEVSATLTTWPQLASAVSLSGAVNTDAARRILLGKFHESGRFYVDLERIVRDGAAEPVALPPAHEGEAPPERDPAPVLSPRPVRAERGLSAEEAQTLVAYAALAPSGGNCQPWKFVLRRGRLLCLHDPARSRASRTLDFEHRATHLAFGAMARNLELAAAEMGRAVAVTPLAEETFEGEDGLRPVCAVEIAAAGSTTVPRELAPFMEARTTNRRVGPARPLEAAHRTALMAAAQRAGAELQLVEDEGARRALGALLGEGDRVRCLSPVMHREMMGEIRWTRAEALATRDGLDVATLELGPVELAGMRLLGNAAVMRAAAEANLGRGLEVPSKRAVAGASAMGLLTIPGTDRAAYFSGGRAVQDVWLTATAQGLAFQPMTALLYMFARLEHGAGEGFSREEQAALRGLRQRFRELFELRAGHAELLLFRISHAPPPSARSLRLRVDELLVIEP